MKENNNAKLDAAAKILIATGQIQYLAHNLSNMLQALVIERAYSDPFGSTSHIIKKGEDLLNSSVERLTHVFEDMSLFMDEWDRSLEIDKRVIQVPFEILVHDMDEVHNPYLPDDEE
ncbi:hypothetical protein SAMN04515674_101499 [Pseudarcicella hirudinis]|uniref:Uncharacterized protein n=1 Tax=Pseudarcicella hirudinis TaxID=1079859 RepID=A0A1I5MXT3_9BACT|nr:hypothetical protein [Pseudarcicella hirudinis]SFP14303.1 hypothetical protein SAMN04515674_101499 [Pseudarcicella hirudinis]